MKSVWRLWKNGPFFVGKSKIRKDWNWSTFIPGSTAGFFGRLQRFMHISIAYIIDMSRTTNTITNTAIPIPNSEIGLSETDRLHKVLIGSADPY